MKLVNKNLLVSSLFLERRMKRRYPIPRKTRPNEQGIHIATSTIIPRITRLRFFILIPPSIRKEI
jgi:hypothetical protein